MEQLRVSFDELDQAEIENLMDEYPKYFALCPHPRIGKIPKGSDLSKYQANIDLFSKDHVVGISMQPIPFNTDSHEQSAFYSRRLLLEILENMPDETILLTMRDDRPLAIQSNKTHSTMFLAPRVEDEDDE